MSEDFRCKFSIYSSSNPDPNVSWSIGTWEICSLTKQTLCDGLEHNRKCCPMWNK